MNFLNIYIISVLSISFGYILSEFLTQTNLIKYIGKKTSKISKIGIHPLLSTIPALYLVSPRLAHTTASSLLKSRDIKEFDLLIAIVASNFPLRLMYIYKYYLPVLVPLLGIVAIYFIILRIIFDIFLLFVIMIVGKKQYNNINNINGINKNTVENKTITESKINYVFSKKVIKEIIKKGLISSFNFAKSFTPIFIVVVYLINSGAMEKLSVFLTPILGNLGLDTIGITYITTAILSPRAAYGIANIMVQYKYSILTILGCMFIGNGLFVVFYEWWSRLLPYYYGLYPKKTALKLIIIQAFLPATYNLFLGILLLFLSNNFKY